MRYHAELNNIYFYKNNASARKKMGRSKKKRKKSKTERPCIREEGRRRNETRVLGIRSEERERDREREEEKDNQVEQN